nr:HLH domain-containing protein [Beroe forskalii]AHA51263.1 HLH domain-containing protein [Beroe forskalii]
MKRIAATTRERSRIEHLNCAFITLRSRIPTQPMDVKLTKVETLRLAMSYIMHLEKLIGEFKENEKSTSSSEVSSTSGPGSKEGTRSEQLACPRAVRVYPAPYPPDHLEYPPWAQQYTGTHPVRPIPTSSLDIPFIVKKDAKQ